MTRALAPEWLDGLPARAAEAIASRHDLRRLNTLMRHPRFVSQALLSCFPRQPPRALAEIGAGDGAFLLKTASRLAAHWPSVRAVLVDRRPALDEATRREFDRLGWSIEVVRADVFDWLEDAKTDAVVANLFLHHFETGPLRRLLNALSIKSSAVVACEPRRAKLPYAASRLLGFIGCNEVTRHDAPISVRAGFRGAELSSLWPSPGWRLREREVGLFSHLFVAHRAP